MASRKQRITAGLKWSGQALRSYEELRNRGVIKTDSYYHRRKFITFYYNAKYANRQVEKLQKQVLSQISKIRLDMSPVRDVGHYNKLVRRLRQIREGTFVRKFNQEMRERAYKNLRNMYGIDTELENQVEVLIDKLKVLDDDTFQKFFLVYKDLQTFLWYPCPDVIERLQIKLDTILERANNFDDIKGFVKTDIGDRGMTGWVEKPKTPKKRGRKKGSKNGKKKG